jgi:membrane-associated phospholipid phosphatase
MRYAPADEPPSTTGWLFACIVYILLKSFMRTLSLSVLKPYIRNWWAFVSVPYNLLNIGISFLFLQASYLTTQVAAIMATKNAGPAINDIVISNVPRIDTSIIHGDLSFLMYDLRFFLLFLLIRYAPFAAKTLACLAFLRAITINLTNLGMPEGIVPIRAEITFGGDLFFSGHVANTFLLALIFWEIKLLRYFFMVTSVVFAVSALLGHYHYSIDVVAAPFFAYGVFAVCKKIFKKDYLASVNSRRTTLG